LTTFNRSLADDNPPYWLWGPLLFSLFYFMQTIIDFNTTSMGDFAVIVLNYCLFILLYAKTIHVRGDKVIPWLFTLTIFIALTTYFTFGSQSLFGYVAFIAGYTLNVKKSFTMLIAIWCAIFISGYYFSQSHPYFLIPALLITAALFGFGFFTQRDTKFRLKEQANKKQLTQLAAIAERERIARDLHDVVGHSLSSIALKSELAEKYLAAGNHDKAGLEINEVASLSREVLSEIRQAVSGLKKQNLAEGLDKLIKELAKHDFKVAYENSLSIIHSGVESAIVLIFTEAVTNILRHSKGNNVAIKLFQSESFIHIRIANNGRVKEFQHGNGLHGMTERCKELNGTIEISSKSGFALTIKLPKGI